MTSFRFGARSVPGQHASAPGRVAGILPGNAGISHAAQDRIDNLTSSAARRAKEAISGIDAVRLFIFQPLKHGPKCNCGTESQDTALMPTSSNSHVLGIIEDRADSADDMKSRVKVRTHDVTAYDRHVAKQPASESDHNFGVDEDDILGDGLITSTNATTGAGPYEGEMHGSGDTYLHSGAYDHERPDSVEDTYGESELLNDWENDGWNPDSVLADSAYVMGSSLATCPVCMGSGIIGGYEIVGGTRMVLSSANATGGENIGAETPTKSPLPIFTLQPGDNVEWSDLGVPNYFTMGWVIARNMRRKLGITILYTLNDGVLWKPISTLGSDNQIDLSNMTITVINESDEPVEFSHLELVMFHTVVLGQVTNFNQAAGLADAVKGDGLTITLPPDVGLVDRNALIADAKYNLMWRVTTVTSIETAKRQIISCEVQAELMQPTLIETTLYPPYSINGPKLLNYGGGVEPVMGMR